MCSRRKLRGKLAERERLLARLALDSGEQAAKLRTSYQRWGRPPVRASEEADRLDELQRALFGALEPPPPKPPRPERVARFVSEWKRELWDRPRKARTEGRESALAERAAGIMAARAAEAANAAEEAEEAEFAHLWPEGEY